MSAQFQIFDGTAFHRLEIFDFMYVLPIRHYDEFFLCCYAFFTSNEDAVALGTPAKRLTEGGSRE